MLAGQVNLTGLSDAARHRVVRDNFDIGDDTKAAFALVYETILGLSEEQCPETGTSGNWLDTDANGGLLTNYDSSGLRSAVNIGSGASEFHTTGRDNAAELGFFGVRYPGSSMGRFMSQGRDLPVGTVPSHCPTDSAARLGRNSGQPVGPDGNAAPPTSSSEVLNKSELSDWMDAHALSRSSRHCAMYVRLGMEAAGLNTEDRPQSGDAGDYGPFLLRHGAQMVPTDSYAPQVGDVVVFDKTAQHPYGHIEMYDGHQWVSDFMQNSFSPYRDAISTPPYTIYRLG
jgi:hypothetical protein